MTARAVCPRCSAWLGFEVDHFLAYNYAGLLSLPARHPYRPEIPVAPFWRITPFVGNSYTLGQLMELIRASDAMESSYQSGSGA